MALAFPRFNLSKGQIYIFNQKNEWTVDERRGDLVWFNERHGPGKKSFNDRELARLFHSGKLVLRPEHLTTETAEQALNQQLLALDTLKPKHQERVKRQHAYVDAYLHAERGGKSGEALCALINDVASRIGDKRKPSPRSVLRWTRRYVERGGDARYLVGRQAFSPERAKRLHPLVIKAMKRVIGRYYLNRARRSIDACYGFLDNELDRLKRRYPQLTDSFRKPSFSTFDREIRRVPAFTRVLLREGKQAAYRQFMIKGKGPCATRPLQIVICDSKVVDVHWVDRWGHVRERLTLTVFIDVYSRMIIGFYLGTSKPSWLAVSQALRNAVAPKDYVSVLYPEIQTPWLCCGSPELVVFDQGSENNNTHAPLVLSTLGIDAVFVPGGWPEFKGIVERFFRTINALFHNLPGTTRSNPKDRGKADKEKKSAQAEAQQAGTTLEALREAVHAWILDYYHNAEHTALAGMSPLQAWQKGIETCFLRPPPSEEQLVILLGKTKICQLQHYGINLFGLIYRAKELAGLRPEKGNVAVQVKWDPSDISKVWIQNPQTKRYIKAVPDDELYTRYLSEAQHKRVWKEARATYAKTRPSPSELRTILARIIAKFIKEKPKGARVRRGVTMDPHRPMPWGNQSRPTPAHEGTEAPTTESAFFAEAPAADDGLWEDDILAVKLKELQRAQNEDATSDSLDLPEADFDPDEDEDEHADEEAPAASADAPAPASQPSAPKRKRAAARRDVTRAPKAAVEAPNGRKAEATDQGGDVAAETALADDDEDDAAIEAIAAGVAVRRRD